MKYRVHENVTANPKKSLTIVAQTHDNERFADDYIQEVVEFILTDKGTN